MSEEENTSWSLAPATPEVQVGTETPAQKTAEAWGEELLTPEWLFAATKHAQNWPAGQELSEADYRDAVENAGQEVIG